jgi:hypothetical protein
LYPIYPQPYGSGFSVNVKGEFTIPDFCSLIPNVPSVGRQFGRATLGEAERVVHERRPSEITSGLQRIRW